MRNKIRIIPWYEQTFQKLGKTEPMYAKVFSVHDWCMTPEQKKRYKK